MMKGQITTTEQMYYVTTAGWYSTTPLRQTPHSGMLLTNTTQLNSSSKCKNNMASNTHTSTT